MTFSGTKTWIENFDRPLTLTTTPEGGTGWTVTDTSAAGAPTYATATEDGGKMVLTIANDTEVENVCMSHNDILMYDVRKIKNFWYIAKVAGITSTTTLVMGMGAARNDTVASVANYAWYKMLGSSSTTALTAGTDDATTADDDNDTGTTLAAVYKRLFVDLSNGISDVRFYVDGARVLSTTTFSLADLGAGLNWQPLVQIQKTSAAGTPAVHIAQFGITYTWSY
jgi:hypothetical protein